MCANVVPADLLLFSKVPSRNAPGTSVTTVRTSEGGPVLDRRQVSRTKVAFRCVECLADSLLSLEAVVRAASRDRHFTCRACRGLGAAPSRIACPRCGDTFSNDGRRCARMCPSCDEKERSRNGRAPTCPSVDKLRRLCARHGVAILLNDDAPVEYQSGPRSHTCTYRPSYVISSGSRVHAYLDVYSKRRSSDVTRRRVVECAERTAALASCSRPYIVVHPRQVPAFSERVRRGEFSA